MTAEDKGIEIWGSAAWRQEATAWLDERLAAAGIERTGDVEQPHLRPWATVLKAPTTQGPVWLKATGPGTSFEVGLYERLNRAASERVLEPIAIDVDRSWIVLPDGGPPLADRVSGDDLVDALAAILPRYGQLQRDLAPEAESLVKLGVTDRRPAAMPRRFEEALVAVGQLVERRGDPAEREAHERVAALRETFTSWCERLAAAPGHASLDHNDLHPWNMLVGDLDRPERVRFYDWGDAVIAHPFATMLVPLGWVRSKLEIGLDDPALLRIRDAYLEVFGDLAPQSELVETLELACRVGMVARALTWDRAVRESDPGEIDDFFALAPLETLHALLEDPYLGGA